MNTTTEIEAAIADGKKQVAAHEQHRRWLAKVKRGEKPAPSLLGLKPDTSEDGETAANSAGAEVVRCIGPQISWIRANE